MLARNLLVIDVIRLMRRRFPLRLPVAAEIPPGIRTGKDYSMKKTRLLRVSAVTLLICLIFAGGSAFAAPALGAEGGDLLRIAYVKDLAPYQVTDDQNMLSGMHVELMNLLAEACEWDIQYVGFPTMSACVTALESGKADLVLGVPLNNTMNTDQFCYTGTLSSTYICMAAENSVAARIKQDEYQFSKIVWEYRSLPYYNMRAYSHDASYVGVGTQRNVASVLLAGEIKVAFADRNSIQYYLRKAGAEDQYTILYNYICPIQYGIAARAEDADLVEELDHAITRVRMGAEFEEITARWVPLEEDEISAFLRRWGVILLSGLLAVVAIFAFVMWLNRYLKTQVQERTQELQQANLRLRQESYLRNQAIRRNPNGILIFDDVGLIDTSNESANHMLGVANAKGRNISEFPLLQQMIGSAGDLLWDQPPANQVVKVQDADGVRSYRYSVEILKDSRKDRKMGFITFEDVTIQDMQHKQMVTWEREKFLNQIVAGVAHEIRNPLSSIKSLAQIAPESKNDEEYLHAFEEIVPAEVDRINRLVDDLIDYTKRPVRQGEKQLVDLGELLESSIGLVQVLARKQDIQVVSRIEGRITLMADRDQLKQAFLNILLNGLDAIKSKGPSTGAGRLSVTAGEDRDAVRVSIRDTGIGMSREAIQNATEPFYTTKSHGTGIGLAISERYIRENGGSLSFESEEGEYTVARIVFPRVSMEEEMK